MEPDATMRDLLAARLAAGADRESIVRELSLNFDYVRCALLAYVDGFVEDTPSLVGAPEGDDSEQPALRSFRLAR